MVGFSFVENNPIKVFKMSGLRFFIIDARSKELLVKSSIIGFNLSIFASLRKKDNKSFKIDIFQKQPPGAKES